MKRNYSAKQFRQKSISSNKENNTEEDTMTLEPPAFQMKASGTSFFHTDKAIQRNPVGQTVDFNELFTDPEYKHIALNLRLERNKETIELYKYNPDQLQGFEGLNDGPAGYLIFKTILDEERSLHSKLKKIGKTHSEYEATLKEYKEIYALVCKKLDLFDPVSKLREKYQERIKADVDELVRLLSNPYGAIVESDKLFRILQFSFQYKDKRDELYKSLTTKDLYTEIRTQMTSIKTDFLWSMAQAYLVAGKLRPADKFYIAVKNSGTDESNVYFAMREGHKNIEQLEKDYTEEYESDLEGKSWLPHTGYGINKWNIAGRIEDDMKGEEELKAKCFISFGQVRPIDQIRMAHEKGDKNALMKALRDVQGIEMEKLEKNAKVCYANPEVMVRKELEAEYKKSWGSSISGVIRDTVIHEKMMEQMPGQSLPSMDDLAFAGSVLTGNVIGANQAFESKSKKFNAETQADIDLAEKILSGKESARDRFFDQLIKNQDKDALVSFSKIPLSEKKIIIDAFDSNPLYKEKNINKFKQIYNFEYMDDPGYKVLKKLQLFDKDSFDRTLKYSIGKSDFDILLKSIRNAEFKNSVKDFLFDSNLLWILSYNDKDTELLQSIIGSKDKEWVTHYLFNLLSQDRRDEFKQHAAYFYKQTSKDLRKDKTYMIFVMNLLENNYAERVKAERKLLTKANSGLGASITNAFSTSGLSAENEQRELEVSLDQAAFDEKITLKEQEGLEQDIEDAKGTRENFESTRNQIEGIATMIIQTAITIAAGILIPGAGSIIAAAVLGGVTSVGTNFLMKGDRYDASQAGKDLIMGGIDGAMGAFAVLKVKNLIASGSKLGTLVSKREIYKSIAQEAIGNSHNVAIDLAKGEGIKGAMLNYGQSIAMGVGIDKISNAAEGMIKKHAADKAVTDQGGDHSSDTADPNKTHQDQDTSHTDKDNNDPNKDEQDQNTGDKNQQDGTIPLGGAHDNSQKPVNDADPNRPITDQDIVQMIRDIGDWDTAVRQLRGFPEGEAMILRMQRIRNDTASLFAGEEFNAHQRSDATQGDRSDMDFNFMGENAGKNMLKAEAFLKAKFGDDWRKLLKMNVFTDGSRLSKYTELKDNPALSDKEYAAMEAAITDRAEQLNIARMLQSAQGNENSLKRVEALLSERPDATQIRELAATTPQEMKTRADKLHLEIDVLVQKYEATLDYKKKAKLAEMISRKQAEANFYTEEAYIGAGALKQEGTSLNDKELRQALTSQLAELEVTIKSYGSSGEAAKEYEVYKYIHRYIAALEAAGVPLSPKLLQFKELSYNIYDIKDNGGTLGRDFNLEKPEGTPGSYVNRRTNEDRAKVMDMFLDEAYSIVGANMTRSKGGAGGDAGNAPTAHGNKANAPTTVEKGTQNIEFDKTDPDNFITSEEIHSDPSFDSLRRGLNEYKNIGEAIARLNGSESFYDQHLLEALLHYKLRKKLKNLPEDGINDLPSESVIRPDSSSDAFTIYHRMVAARRDLETAVYFNPVTKEYIVVQGERGEVSTTNERGKTEGHTLSKKQKWQEVLEATGGRLELVAHSHPVNYDGKVADANRLPSGERGDFGVLIRESAEAGHVRRTSTIHYGDGAMEGSTTFTFDPYDSHPFVVNFTDPKTNQKRTKAFEELADFHKWMEKEFNVDMGPVSKEMADYLKKLKTEYKAPRRPSDYPPGVTVSYDQMMADAIRGYGSSDAAISGLMFSFNPADIALAAYIKTQISISQMPTAPGVIGQAGLAPPDFNLGTPSANPNATPDTVEKGRIDINNEDPLRYSAGEHFGEQNPDMSPQARYRGDFKLAPDGFIEADVMLRNDELKTRSSMSGKDLFSNAIEHFKSSGQKVEGLRSSWGDGDNLAIFQAELENQLKLHPEDLKLCYENAARETYSYKWASGKGFSKIRFKHPASFSTDIPKTVEVEFY